MGSIIGGLNTNLRGEGIPTSIELSNMLNWDKKDRVIDIDNLQGICIYLVFAMKYPYIISEFFIIQEFVSKHVSLSSRSIFLNVMKGGVDYLLNCIEREKEL